MGTSVLVAGAPRSPSLQRADAACCCRCTRLLHPARACCSAALLCGRRSDQSLPAPSGHQERSPGSACACCGRRPPDHWRPPLHPAQGAPWAPPLERFMSPPWAAQLHHRQPALDPHFPPPQQRFAEPPLWQRPALQRAPAPVHAQYAQAGAPQAGRPPAQPPWAAPGLHAPQAPDAQPALPAGFAPASLPQPAAQPGASCWQAVRVRALTEPCRDQARVQAPPRLPHLPRLHRLRRLHRLQGPGQAPLQLQASWRRRPQRLRSSARPGTPQPIS